MTLTLTLTLNLALTLTLTLALTLTKVTPSLVRVYFDIPYQIDGVVGLKYVGAGVVVDAKLGLVLVDRNTVPVAPRLRLS